MSSVFTKRTDLAKTAWHKAMVRCSIVIKRPLAQGTKHLYMAILSVILGVNLGDKNMLKEIDSHKGGNCKRKLYTPSLNCLAWSHGRTIQFHYIPLAQCAKHLYMAILSATLGVNLLIEIDSQKGGKL